MRVLQVHNFYQQAGGEDQVVAAEQALLTSRGHTVLQYTVHNDAVNKLSTLELGAKTLWNQETYRKIRSLIAKEQVDLVHAHNTLPLVSPAVYWAASAQRVPLVQTLHNYRLLCPAATFFRQGQICELCLQKTIKLPAILNRCYRASSGASAAVAAMLAIHKLSGSYQHKVNTYIALSEFARAKFCEGGLPEKRLVVKPNFLADDPGVGTGAGGYALFLGRLTEEKGLATLLDAWSQQGQVTQLKIAGDGPMQTYVRARSAAIPNVEYLGPCDRSHVIDLLKNAAFLVFPSRWYEGLPMVVLEAMACGTPVVAFAVGAMNDLIINGVNGIKLPLEDRNALPDFLRDFAKFPLNVNRLRRTARVHFEANFMASTNYGLLLEIYQQTLNQTHSVS